MKVDCIVANNQLFWMIWTRNLCQNYNCSPDFFGTLKTTNKYFYVSFTTETFLKSENDLIDTLGFNASHLNRTGKGWDGSSNRVDLFLECSTLPNLCVENEITERVGIKVTTNQSSYTILRLYSVSFIT